MCIYALQSFTLLYFTFFCCISMSALHIKSFFRTVPCGLRGVNRFNLISFRQLQEPSNQWNRYRGAWSKQEAHHDTIYALSSGVGAQATGVAVVRISGPSAWKVLESLCGGKTSAQDIKPRCASLKSLHCPATKDKLDKALVLWFPGPKSFTGEDVVELHVHGSRAVISGLFSAMEHLDSRDSEFSIRPADRGEFTRRAFDNGKMDLTEVEGLADLLAADTSKQRQQALKQMEGQLRKTYERWRGELMKCLAHTEAVIDFGDDDREGDINDSAMGPLFPIVERLRSELQYHLQDGRKGEIIREGIQIALVGQPNAGKSSLMNALARRPAAIVSPIAGTTRDIVEVRMDLGGASCIVRDTAGLRQNTTDEIELEGMQRARDAFKKAHVRIFVVDISSKDAIQEAAELYNDIQEFLRNERVSTEDNDGTPSSQSLMRVVFNKADLISEPQEESLRIQLWQTLTSTHTTMVTKPDFISCLNGHGLEALENGISGSIQELLTSNNDSDSFSSEGVMITRERHRRHVRQCVNHLEAFLFDSLPMDLAAEEIRLAMQELGKVTGRVDVEELLDIIFRDFCIGK